MLNFISSIINKFSKKQLVKTTFFSGLSTVVKLSTNFIIAKFVAIRLGPSGIAMIGQIGNFINISRIISTGAINAGVTKYIAEYNGNNEYQKDIIGTSVIINLILSFFVSLYLIIFSKQISIDLLLNDKFQIIFVAFGITIYLYSLNNLFLSILNGFKQFKSYIIANISNSIMSLTFVLVLTNLYGLNGALFSLVTSQSIVFFITLFFIHKEGWFNFNSLKRFKKEVFVKLIKFSLMMAVAGFVVPFVNIGIRKYLIQNFGVSQTGYWEAVNRISDIYLSIVTVSISTYYLPRLSELKEKLELRLEIFNSYKILIPMVILISSSIFLMKDLIIKILFTAEFIEMRPLFLPQLIGDNMKIATYLIGYLLIAKAMLKEFIILEVLLRFFYYYLVTILCPKFGLVGATYSYILFQLIYFLLLIFVFRKLLFK